MYDVMVAYIILDERVRCYNSKGWDEVVDNSGICNGSQAIVDIVNLLQKEVQANVLQAVPFDIYSNTASIIEALRVSTYEGLEDLIKNSVLELVSESIDLLFEARYQKMLDDSEALSASSTSMKTVTQSTDYSKITDEEKYFLEGARELGKRRMEILKAVVFGSPKVLESVSKEAHSKQTIIMFLKPMEQFMGVDMNKYGPFLQDDVAVLPSENARSLIEKKFAIELQGR